MIVFMFLLKGGGGARVVLSPQTTGSSVKERRHGMQVCAPHHSQSLAVIIQPTLATENKNDAQGWRPLDQAPQNLIFFY